MTVQRQTPERLKAFAQYGWFDRVTEISVFGEKVTDEIVPHIRQFKLLKQLDFGAATKISPAGLQQLRSALPDCQISNVSRISLSVSWTGL